MLYWSYRYTDAFNRCNGTIKTPVERSLAVLAVVMLQLFGLFYWWYTTLRLEYRGLITLNKVRWRVARCLTRRD
jgi:hypothetical protein